MKSFLATSFWPPQKIHRSTSRLLSNILELFFSRNNHPPTELVKTPLVHNELENNKFSQVIKLLDNRINKLNSKLNNNQILHL